MTLNYVLQDKSITLSNGKNSFIVSVEQEELYKLIKNVLLTPTPKEYDTRFLDSVLGQVPEYGLKGAGRAAVHRMTCDYLEQNYSHLFNIKDGVIYANDEHQVNSDILRGINRFIKHEYPLEPIVRFVDRVSTLTPSVSQGLQKAVGSGHYPLTWDGKMIAYKRASWGNGTTRITAWGGQFIPGQYVKADEGDSLMVTTFDWTANVCTDCGNFYELVVDPADILTINQGGDKLTASGYYNLRQLPIATKASENPHENLVLVSLSTTKYGEIAYRNPYSEESMNEFLQLFKEGLNCTLNSGVDLVTTPVVSC